MIPVEKTTRKISSSGGYSRVISLPRRFLAKLGWREKQNKVIDADTLEIQDGRSLRLTAVNAPDAGPIAKQANEFTGQRLTNQIVTLEYEKNYEQDRFGRLNAYVFVAGTNHNLDLVKNGLAEVVIYDKRRPWKYQQELLSAQDAARKQKLGIWSTSVK